MQINLFDILKSISQTKKDLSNEDGFEKAYNPFMINRYLSMCADTLNDALFMTQNWTMDKKKQYKFFLYFIPSENRFFKYPKKNKDKEDKNIEMLMKYFNVNEDKAKEYLEFLDKTQLKEIKDSFGGKK